jgi:GntR family transcriptional regulator
MAVGLAKSIRVAKALERDILEGRAVHGDQLDSEGQLMQRFSVSRNTVRRGLGLLASQGMITKRCGIGSFVTYDGTTIDNALGWSVALEQGGGRLETQLISCRREPSTQADGFLNLSDGDYFRLDRLRRDPQAEKTLSLERSCLPWRPEFAPILAQWSENDSLSRVLAGLGLTPFSGEERASVVSLSDNEAQIMGRVAGKPMLRLQRMTRTENSDIIEYVESILDPTRFGLRMQF